MIGRCTTIIHGQTKKQQCSNLASRCDEPNGFIPHDPTCTIVHDFFHDNWTFYGKCVTTRRNNDHYYYDDDHQYDDDQQQQHCSFLPQDCHDKEIWIPNDITCTANQVPIGACYAGGQVFCSVSSDNCIEPQEPYYNHFVIQEELGIDCVLFDYNLLMLMTENAITTMETNMSNNNKNNNKTMELLLSSLNRSSSSWWWEIMTLIIAGIGGMILGMILFYLWKIALNEMMTLTSLESMMEHSNHHHHNNNNNMNNNMNNNHDISSPSWWFPLG